MEGSIRQPNSEHNKTGSTPRKLNELENRMNGLESSRNEYADLDRKRAELKEELDKLFREGVFSMRKSRQSKGSGLRDKIARRKDLTATQLLIDKPLLFGRS